MVIADSGFWVALINRKDHFHAAARDVLAGLTDDLITTWPVLTEAAHLVLSRIGTTAQSRLMDFYLNGGTAVFDLNRDHAIPMQRLMADYADLPMDLADASLVVLAEHLNDGRILSTDQRDFKTYRWKNRKPFKNILAV